MAGFEQWRVRVQLNADGLGFQSSFVPKPTPFYVLVDKIHGSGRAC